MIGAEVELRARKRGDGEYLTIDDIRLILTSDGSNQHVGQIINVLAKTVDDVRMGRIHADKLPELPRRNKKSPKLSCLDCKFWDTECIRPCRLGWPDPETYGPKYANECDDYFAR